MDEQTPSTSTAEAARRNVTGKSRKRIVQPATHKKNIIKQARLSHVQYKNYRGNIVPAPESEFTPDIKCRAKCRKIPITMKRELLHGFLTCASKNEQDVHLYKAIEVVPIKQRRRRNLEESRKRETRDRTCSFRDNLSGSEGNFEVCKRCFMGVFGITESRVKRICNKLISGESPKDNRGKGPSANRTPNNIFQLVQKHIASFPVTQSHYKDENYYYLGSHLTVKLMHQMYLQKFPNERVSYWYYLKIFNEHFSLRFKPPQVDICIKCEELSVKIRDKTITDERKRHLIAEKLIHIRHAKKFYKKLREIQERSQQDEETLGISFDFMQNLSLPAIPIQSTFYLRQLTVSVFSVCDFKTNQSHFFLYDECTGGKGPNDVASLIWNYIQTYVPTSVKNLHVFCDNCPPQNKNHTVLTFFMSLVQMHFESVNIYYPIRGHSFLPNDRTFANVKRNIKRLERVYTTREYATAIIVNTNGNYFVTFVNRSDIIDIKAWSSFHYKKKTISEETRHATRNERQEFAISKLFHFTFTREDHGTITARPSIGSLLHSSYILRRKSKSVSIPLNFKPLRVKKVMTKEKQADLLKFQPYIPNKRRILRFWRRKVPGFRL